jgi:TatD DNase family protein
MIDVHCHLNFPEFTNDLDKVIQRAKAKGVEKIINVGTSIHYSKQVVDLANKYPEFYAIVGVHPHDAGKLEKNWDKELEALTKNPKVLAIGEIGLDYFSHNNVDKKIQQAVFEKQIEISLKLKLPLQIHSRKAAEDMIAILKNYKNRLLNPPGMFHCMAGDLSYLKNVLDLGFYIGFDGNITYKGLAPGEDTPLIDLVKYTPKEKIVVETDAPFLSPIPYRGSRNEPSYVIITADSIAKIKGVSFKEIEKNSTINSETIFKL